MDHSLYFEDLEEGQVFESTGRTVTETDMTFFSMLSGDWNPIHCDQDFASKTRFGERLVVNGRDEVVQDGVSDMLILKKSGR